MDKEKPKKRPEPTPESRVVAAAIARLKSQDPPIEGKDIADQLNVDPTLISQFATARRPVPMEKAVPLAEILGERPEDISRKYRETMARFGLFDAEQQPQAPKPSDLEDDFDAMSLFLGALVAVMVEHRPAEARALATVVKRQVPKKYRNKGLIRDLLAGLDRSPD
jgi:transcriptional regulator with XRE-family HTH domain